MKTVDYLHFHLIGLEAYCGANRYSINRYSITRGEEGAFEGYLWRTPVGKIHLDAPSHNGSWDMDELFTIVEFAKTL